MRTWRWLVILAAALAGGGVFLCASHESTAFVAALVIASVSLAFAAGYLASESDHA